MDSTVLIGLSRQTALQRSLDVIANNVANLNTTGFKTAGVSFEEFLRSSGPGAFRSASLTVDRNTWHDMRAGARQQTGNPLDVAVDGTGFLVLQTPQGERYTRNGSLQVNAAGQLVSEGGAPVLGEGGPITLQPNDRQIAIARDGTVSTSNGQRGKLRIVDFAQPGRLLKSEGSSFAAPAGVQPQPAPQSGVIQGAIEKSNVQSVLEMTRMIDVTRTYTSMAQLAQTHSDMRRSAIERLAEVPA